MKKSKSYYINIFCYLFMIIYTFLLVILDVFLIHSQTIQFCLLMVPCYVATIIYLILENKENMPRTKFIYKMHSISIIFFTFFIAIDVAIIKEFDFGFIKTIMVSVPALIWILTIIIHLDDRKENFND